MQTSQFFFLFWVGLIFWVLGQIWLAQLVVYPLFAKVGAADYIGYHRFYSRHIPLPVIIPGFASFILPVPLALLGPSLPAWMSIANIAAGVVGLVVTVLLEIPRHFRLESDGKNDAMIAELIRYNWPRTLSITVQAIVTFLMLRHVVGAV